MSDKTKIDSPKDEGHWYDGLTSVYNTAVEKAEPFIENLKEAWDNTTFFGKDSNDETNAPNSIVKKVEEAQDNTTLFNKVSNAVTNLVNPVVENLVNPVVEKVEEIWDDTKTKLLNKASDAFDSALDTAKEKIGEALDTIGSKFVNFFTDTLIDKLKDGLNAIANFFIGFFTDEKIDLFGDNDPVNAKVMKDMEMAANGSAPALAATVPTPEPGPS